MVKNYRKSRIMLVYDNISKSRPYVESLRLAATIRPKIELHLWRWWLANLTKYARLSIQGFFVHKFYIFFLVNWTYAYLRLPNQNYFSQYGYFCILYLPRSSDLQTPNGVSLSVKLFTKSIFESVAATIVGGEAALILNSVKLKLGLSFWNASSL